MKQPILYEVERLQRRKDISIQTLKINKHFPEICVLVEWRERRMIQSEGTHNRIYSCPIIMYT